MLVRCPRCGTVQEAQPGADAACATCRLTARVPPAGHASPAPDPTPQPPSLRRLAGPFGAVASLVGVGTFYLAALVFPLVLSGVGIGLGLAASRDPRGVAAILLGLTGLALGAVTLWLA